MYILYNEVKILRFSNRYQSEFGFTIPDRSVVVDDIRVRGVGKALINLEEYVEEASSEAVPENVRLNYKVHEVPLNPVSYTHLTISRGPSGRLSEPNRQASAQLACKCLENGSP